MRQNNTSFIITLYFILVNLQFLHINAESDVKSEYYLRDPVLDNYMTPNGMAFYTNSLVICCTFCTNSNSESVIYNIQSQLCKCLQEVHTVYTGWTIEEGMRVFYRKSQETTTNTASGVIETTTQSSTSTASIQDQDSSTAITSSTYDASSVSTPVETTTSTAGGIMETTMQSSGFGIVNVSCENNQIIKKLITEYDSNTNDRNWNLECTTLHIGTLQSCSWTDFIHIYHGATSPLYYGCPNSGIITGLYSEFNSSLTDRRYKLFCCELNGAALDTSSYQWANMAYTRDMNIDLPTGNVIYQIISLYNSVYKDRQLKFRNCPIV